MKRLFLAALVALANCAPLGKSMQTMGNSISAPSRATCYEQSDCHSREVCAATPGSAYRGTCVKGAGY
jgi:hypothetical protein